MTALIEYMIKFSILLAAQYLLYYALFRRLTFFRWNRLYFICSIGISLAFPFINIIFLFPNTNAKTAALLNTLPVITNISPISSHQANNFNISVLIGLIILTGSFALTCRLIIQFVSLIKLKNNSLITSHEDNISYYRPPNSTPSFSFGRMIFINKNIHSAIQINQIIAHEKIHVQQHHTADIILMELLCIFNWFNPFAWLLKKAVRQNLEFIADDAVFSSIPNNKDYQYAVLHSASGNNVPLTNSFSMPHIKKRIIMMNKNKSSKIHLIKFFTVLPLLFFVLLLFRNDLLAQTEGFMKITSESGVTIETNPKNGDPLYIIDGVYHHKNYNKDRIKPSDIVSITVWKGAEAIKKFGKEAKDGAIEIITKIPLIVIDKKIQFKTSILDELVKPDDVESINVLKDISAEEKYGDKGKNGVIEITTKKKPSLEIN